MKYICIKEFLDYQEGDMADFEIVVDMEAGIETCIFVNHITGLLECFDLMDLDIYFVSIADYREEQINSILSDE